MIEIESYLFQLSISAIYFNYNNLGISRYLSTRKYSKSERYKVTVCIPRFAASTFSSFFFFFLRVNSNLTWVHCSRTVQYCSYTVYVLKNIKIRSHDTIYTFKNYFATVFSVFSNNKLNPNGPKTKQAKFDSFNLVHCSILLSTFDFMCNPAKGTQIVK